MLTRKLVVQCVRTLPKSFPMNELVDRIAVAQKIEEGIEQSRREKSYPTEDSRTRLITNLRFSTVRQ
jgi:hypothetical protein